MLAILYFSVVALALGRRTRGYRQTATVRAKEEVDLVRGDQLLRQVNLASKTSVTPSGTAGGFQLLHLLSRLRTTIAQVRPRIERILCSARNSM